MPARTTSKGAPRCPSVAARQLRTDAERNRQAILAAATAAFARDGLDASLEDIARAAGVGSATLYRRFPTRADLVAAAVEDCISAYADLVEAAESTGDAWKAFCDVLYAVGERQEADAGLSDLLTMPNAMAPPLRRHTRRAVDALERLLARAKTQGDLRSDFDASDATIMFIANAGIIASGRADSRAMRVRHTTLMIDAARATRARPRRTRR